MFRGSVSKGVTNLLTSTKYISGIVRGILMPSITFLEQP